MCISKYFKNYSVVSKNQSFNHQWNNPQVNCIQNAPYKYSINAIYIYIYH